MAAATPASFLILASRIVQFIPALPGHKAWSCPALATWDGQDPLPLLEEEPVVAWAIYEAGSEQWTAALVVDEDEGGLMPAYDLPNFMGLSLPNTEPRACATALAEAVVAKRAALRHKQAT